METVYVAGGCLWGVQAFFKTIPGIISTEAGRANGKTQTLDGNYDGYAECVKLTYDPEVLSIYKIMEYLFEVIDPYSVNKTRHDVGEKYRTGFYSRDDQHLQEAKDFINQREDCFKIKVEVLPLSNYVKSASEHQDRLEHYPEDHHMCHIPLHLLNKYNKIDHKDVVYFMVKIICVYHQMYLVNLMLLILVSLMRVVHLFTMASFKVFISCYT